MAKRAAFPLLFISLLLVLLLNAGCSLRPSTFFSVVLTPNAPQTVAEGATVSIQANALNDTSMQGVSWTLTPPTGEGSLTTSTTQATYNAPTPVTTAFTVTITATSIAHPNQSSSLKITVEPPPSIAPQTLPVGIENIPYTATITATGGVPPLTWSLAAGSGILPPGLTLGTSTTDTVTIQGKPTQAGTFPIIIQVSDSVGSPPATANLSITISNLAIVTTSPLPSGTVNTLYGPVQFTASGGTTPYTWAVATGSTLPSGLTLTSAGVLSGSLATGAATSTFNITLTDSGTPPASITASFTLPVAGAGTNNSQLSGNYAFNFSGFNASGNIVVAAGSFTADGAGNIKNGLEDVNSGAGSTTQTFTGTYTLGSDNRGTLNFTSLPGLPVYAIAMEAITAPSTVTTTGRLTEFDASGTRGSGQIEMQSVTSCSASTFASGALGINYAFGVTGFEASVGGVTAPGPVAMAGRFATAPPVSPATQGSIGNGEADANAPGNVTFNTSVSGTYGPGSKSNVCTFSLQPQTFPSLTFSVYPISSAAAFLVETDKVGTTEPYLLVGEMLEQIGSPFASPSILSGASVGGMVGQFLSGTTYFPDVAVVQFTASGSGGMTMFVEDNQGGTVSDWGSGTAGLTGINYLVDTLGRVTTNLIHPFDPVFYIINQNEAFCVGALVGGPIFGHFQPQSMGTATSFAAALIKGAFEEGTSFPATGSVPNFSGAIALDGISAISGTQDESVLSGTTTTPGTSIVVGTYAIKPVSGATTGGGTVTLTAPAATTGDFFIVSPTKIVLITTTTSDSNPVLIFLGNWQDD